jgi:hypothetical protein
MLLSGPFQQTFPPFPDISQKVGPRVRMDYVTRSELLIHLMFLWRSSSSLILNQAPYFCVAVAVMFQTALANK